MKPRIAIYCLIVLLIASFIIICGCLGTSSNSLPSNKYVGLQLEIVDAGMLVEDTYPYPGMAQPGAIFYPEHNYSCPKNDSLKIMAGIIKTRGSVVDLKNSLDVVGIYSLPYDLEPRLTINGVDKNGTVEMLFGNESISLQSGSSWSSPVISVWNETNTIKYPPPNDVTGEDTGKNYTYTIQYSRRWTIENRGIYDK